MRLTTDGHKTPRALSATAELPNIVDLLYLELLMLEARCVSRAVRIELFTAGDWSTLSSNGVLFEYSEQPYL